jgi:hypothetical protein
LIFYGHGDPNDPINTVDFHEKAVRSSSSDLSEHGQFYVGNTLG